MTYLQDENGGKVKLFSFWISLSDLNRAASCYHQKQMKTDCVESGCDDGDCDCDYSPLW
jgi:hypothetical protein